MASGKTEVTITKTQNGTITPETGITFTGPMCKRYGNVVYIYVATGADMLLSLTKSFTKIATVSSEFRPMSTIIRICILYDADGRNRMDGLIQLGTNGAISVAAPAVQDFGFLRGEFCFVL